jgi:TolB-like protein
VQRFGQELLNGDLEAAVARYTGPFLDGVHIGGAPEFERWVDERRVELSARCHEALETLARGAERRGDALSAMKWWRQLQGSDPLNGRVALELMRAFDAVGDRAAAIRHARIHELLMREELGIPPDPAVVDFAERLRAAGPGADAPPREPASDRPVLPRESPSLAAAPIPGPPLPVDPAGAAPRPSLRRPALVLVMAVVVFAAFALPRLLPDRTEASGADSAEAVPAVSLAVLPFADLSPAGDQEYFSDGITEELLNTLAQNPGLRVPARTSSFYFKGRNLPVGEIAARLGVDAVLEGSVRKAGDRIRITAQLIDAREDRHLWSENFDRPMDDIFAVQSEIAELVAEALRVRLSPTARSRAPSTGNPAAHDVYLRGLFHWNRRSGVDLGHAVDFFEEATRIDPGYARAYAGLALAYAVLPIGFTPSITADEARRRVETAAARALELDSTLAEPHAALALSYHFDWRMEDAEREYLRALALNPAYATAHQWYGEHLAKTGRGEEGEAAVRRAIELDPLSLVAHNDLGLVLMLNRRYPEAVAQLERTVRMDPGFAHPLYFLHRIHLMEGRSDASEEAGRRWAELTGAAAPDEIVTLARATRDADLRPAALSILREWENVDSPRWLDIAFYHVQFGEHDAALRMLEEGVWHRAPMMMQIGVAPWVDPLRDDPRMDRLLRMVGFR